MTCKECEEQARLLGMVEVAIRDVFPAVRKAALV